MLDGLWSTEPVIELAEYRQYMGELDRRDRICAELLETMLPRAFGRRGLGAVTREAEQ